MTENGEISDYQYMYLFTDDTAADEFEVFFMKGKLNGIRLNGNDYHTIKCSAVNKQRKKL